MPNEVVSAALLYANAYRSLHQHLSQVLNPYNLTLLEWSFLTVIADHPESTMRQYAQLMSFDAPHITQLAQTLSERDLISIKPAKNDKRMKHLALTETGTRRAADAHREIFKEAQAIFDGLTRTELNTHLKVLGHIIQKTS